MYHSTDCATHHIEYQGSSYKCTERKQIKQPCSIGLSPYHIALMKTTGISIDCVGGLGCLKAPPFNGKQIDQNPTIPTSPRHPDRSKSVRGLFLAWLACLRPTHNAVIRRTLDKSRRHDMYQSLIFFIKRA